MIPSNEDALKRMRELADRNIANGGWGDETTTPGVPGGEVPLTPKEAPARMTVNHILGKNGGLKLPKRTN